MTQEERKKIYAALAAPFPEEAIERTDGRVTGKGYSTTGIKYQYVADRLNEVLGVGGFRTERQVTLKETTTSKGRPAFEAVCQISLELGEWVNGQFMVFAEALGDGGHTATSEADARKGAFTSALKKAAALLGPGREAYRGTLDDDHVVDEPAGVGHFEDPAPRRSAPPPATQESPVQRPPLRVAAASTDSPKSTAKVISAPATIVPASPPARARITSKQLAALWAIARRLNYDQSSFRARVREHFNAQPEFLTKDQASQLIDMLANSGPANGNGTGHDRARQPGEDG